MITITLSNGYKINGLSKNGDNFASLSPITEDVFLNNTSPVTITEDGFNETHAHMELVQITTMGDECWFVLRDLTDDEIHQIDLEAKIDYIAMMTGIDLEDSNV